MKLDMVYTNQFDDCPEAPLFGQNNWALLRRKHTIEIEINCVVC